jgi:hypothetical protein
MGFSSSKKGKLLTRESIRSWLAKAFGVDKGAFHPVYLGYARRCTAAAI